MSNYIATLLTLFVLELVVKLILLATGRIPGRTPGTMLADTVMLCLAIGWGLWVLAKEAA